MNSINKLGEIQPSASRAPETAQIQSMKEIQQNSQQEFRNHQAKARLFQDKKYHSN